MEPKIRIGTRGSQLAVIQAEMVKNLLMDKNDMLKVDLSVIKTTGDKNLVSPLAEIGDKGLFTKELETALLEERIDIAVHSLKDLPTVLPEGIILGGVLKREDPRDAFVSKRGLKLLDMPEGSVIATSSLRRRSQILRLGRKFTVIPIRGNVGTRLAKLESGYSDGIILACAGMIRLGFEERITEKLDPELVLPAVSQGIIGIEIKKNNVFARKLVSKVNHFETAVVAEAERAFLDFLGGGCHTPVGCYSVINRGKYRLKGFVSDPDGEQVIVRENEGTVENAVAIALKTAEQILSGGGKNILETNGG